MPAGDTSILTQVTIEALDFAKEVAREIGMEYPQGFGLVEVSTKEVRNLIRVAISGDNEPMEKYQGRTALEELEQLEARNGPAIWGEIEAVLEDYGTSVDAVRAAIMATPANPLPSTDQGAGNIGPGLIPEEGVNYAL